MKKLNRRSKQTSASDADDVKKDYEKRIRDLEMENGDFMREIEELSIKLANVSSTPDVGVRKLKEDYPQRSNALEEQVPELKKKPTMQSQFSTQKHKSEEASKQLQDETQKLKAQKVQLQCKMKLDSVQFRLCKASLEKEILQLKKEQRRNEFEMRILLALNKQQKLVLKRKTEEAFVAMKRLKQLLEFRKNPSCRTAGLRNGNCPEIQDIEDEIEVTMKFHELHSEYERQMEEMTDEVKNLKLGAEALKEENSRCLLQENEVDFRLMDSELRDLKEEVARLTSLVSQIETPKSQLSECDKSQVHPVQSSISVGSSINSLDVDSSPSEHSNEIIATMEKTTTEVCCSCSKKSLCKTLKCGCKAAGSICGTSCGCATSKCTNRKVSIKSDDSMQLEMSEGNATCSGIVGKENSSVFASQGAQVEKPPIRNDNGRPRKQPLHDIGNTLIKSFVVKAGRRKKGEKPVIQAGFVENKDAI